MDKLTLYTAEICPYAQRTRMLLGEKQITHELIEIDIDDKPDWFVAMTPGQRVPVIAHGDFVIGESAIINDYLDARFEGPRFTPSEPRQRAFMQNEIRYFDSVFLPVFYKFLFEQEHARQDELREQIYSQLRFLNAQVASFQDQFGGGPWWLGSSLSLADFSMFPFFERFDVFDHYRGFALPDDCTHLRRWWDSMLERDAVAATMHDLDYFIPRYTGYAGATAQGLSAQAFKSGAVN